MLKLNILLEAKMIQADTYQAALTIIRLLEKKYQVSPVAMELMITHLVMATERVRVNQIVEPMTEVIYANIVASESFKVATQALDEILQLSVVEFPDSEQQYLLLHLCNLMKGKNQYEVS